MNRILAVLLVILTLSALVGCSSSGETAFQPAQTTRTTPAAKARVLRMAIPSPPGDPIVTNIEKFVNAFNEQAKDQYYIEIHAGESLIKTADSLDALKARAIEMNVWPIGAFGGSDPNFAAAEIPFLVNSVEADAALQVEILPLYESIMIKKFNIRPIYTHTCTGLDMISNKQVKTAADWKGLLVQSVSPQTAQFIKLMGGASVPIPFPDAYQGIQKNTINATLQSASMMIAFKLNEAAKYVLRGYLTPAAVVISINQDVFNEMPVDIQDLMVKLGKQAQADTNQFFINVYQENYRTLAGVGVTTYNLPKSERDIWVKNLQPYCDELYSKMDPDFARKLKEIGTKLDQEYPYKE